MTQIVRHTRHTMHSALSTLHYALLVLLPVLFPMLLTAANPQSTSFAEIRRDWNYLIPTGKAPIESIFVQTHCEAMPNGIALQTNGTSPIIGVLQDSTVLTLYTQADSIWFPQNASGMFSNMHKLSHIDTEYFNTSRCTNLSSIFCACHALTEVNVRGWDVHNVTVMTQVFAMMHTLQTLDVSTWSLPRLQSAAAAFGEDYAVTEIKMPVIAGPVDNLSLFLEGNRQMTEVDLSAWDFSEVINTNRALDGMRNLKRIITPRAVPPAGIISCSLPTPPAGKMWCVSGTDVPVTDLFAVPVKSELVLEDVVVPHIDAVLSSAWKSLIPDYTHASALRILTGRSTLPTGTHVEAEGAAPIIAIWSASNSDSILVFYTKEDHINLPETSTNIFSKMSKMRHIDVHKIYTSGVTSLSSCFSYDQALQKLDLRHWDVSEVKKLTEMFWHCESLDSIDLSTWDVRKLTDAQTMLGECHKLRYANVSGWNLDRCISVKWMFLDCFELQTVDIANWTAAKPLNMRDMFFQCHQLQRLDMHTCDLHAKNYFRMAEGCRALTYCDLRGLDVTLSYPITEDTATYADAFKGCSELLELYTPYAMPKYGPALPKKTGYLWRVEGSDMVIDSLVQAPGAAHLVHVKTPAILSNEWQSMLSNPDAVTRVNLRVKATTPGAGDTVSVPDYCPIVASLQDGILTLSTTCDSIYLPEDCSGLFSGLRHLQTIDGQYINTTRVTNMSGMFRNDPALVSVSLSKWDVQWIQRFDSMFYGCSSLHSLDLGLWDMSYATSIDHFIDGCRSLTFIISPSFAPGLPCPLPPIEDKTWRIDCDGDIYTDLFAVPARTRLQTCEHSWGETTYEWSSDSLSCTAYSYCLPDSIHMRQETTRAHKEMVLATPEADGFITYTAVFKSDWCETQVCTIVLYYNDNDNDDENDNDNENEDGDGDEPTPDLPTGEDTLQGHTPSAEKKLVQGQLLIIRDGITYTIMGNRLGL